MENSIMKKVCLPLIIAAAGLLVSCTNATTDTVPECTDSVEGNCVYICTGGSSEKYHCTDTCTALASCSKEVQRVSIEYATKKGRTTARWRRT